MEHKPLAIPIECSDLSPRILQGDLAEFLSVSNVPIELELRPRSPRLRSSVGDPSVLVAVLAGGAAAISALVSGLLRVVEKRQDKTGKVVVRGASGAAVEVPVGTSLEEISKLIEVAKKLDQPGIVLHL
jgi:hypothetical protein